MFKNGKYEKEILSVCNEFAKECEEKIRKKQNHEGQRITVKGLFAKQYGSRKTV